MVNKPGAPYALAVEKNVPIEVGDGNMLYANVYRPDRPDSGDRFPVIVAHGIYGKDVHFADAYAPQWHKLNELHPELFQGESSGKYVRWETADPERWVPHGYVLIQVDARGTGQSAGFLDPFSPREIQDYCETIEWAARQPWASGKVGLLGISYYAISQWLVAALQPPPLAAIIPWEGGSDHYRDWSHHGGIHSNTFTEAWWPRQVLPNQNGNSATAHRDRDTGRATTGAPLAPEILEANRAAYVEEIGRHPLADAWHAQRSPRFDRIRVPLLSAGNWGGAGLHLRGNIEGWMRAASTRKWLSIHDGTHFESFYLPQYVEMQRRFFDRYLKDIDNGWESEPPVQLSIRHPHTPSVRRAEQEFPLARTVWTRFYLDAAERTLSCSANPDPASAGYAATDGRLDFTSRPLKADTEFTGFVSLRLWLASSTRDADVFATLRALDPDGKEVIFQGASEPVPVARGWQRASHRRIDPARSTPFRTFHPHDTRESLVPGEPCELDLEMWPTSIVLPKGYRLVLTLTGRDLEFDGIPGRILHTRTNRDEDFCGRTTIHTGAKTASCLAMPLIPVRPKA